MIGQLFEFCLIYLRDAAKYPSTALHNRIVRPNLPIVLRLRDPALGFSIREMVYFLPESWDSREGVIPRIFPCIQIKSNCAWNQDSI